MIDIDRESTSEIESAIDSAIESHDRRQLASALRIEQGKERAWRNVSARIGLTGKNATTIPMWRHALRVAAVLIPLTFVVLFAVTQRVSSPEPLTFTSSGQTDTISLPDGSSVLLGAHSSLSYYDDEDGRHTSLTGIALFTVQRDASSPFTVTAGDVLVTVLGTTFSVENRETQARVRTRVEQGRVAVSVGDQKVLLTKGQEAVYSEGSLASQVSISPTVEIDTRNLTFRKASLQQVIGELMTVYHDQISSVVNNSPNDSTLISTTFVGQPIETVLDELTIHFGKNIALKGDRLVISQ